MCTYQKWLSQDKVCILIVLLMSDSFLTVSNRIYNMTLSGLPIYLDFLNIFAGFQQLCVALQSYLVLTRQSQLGFPSSGLC